MLRISKLSDYAIVLLSCLASRDASPANAKTVADVTRIAQPTVVKLLKMLTSAGLLNSVQGRHGGYTLARDPKAISLTEIIEAVDGPIAMTECTTDDSGCGIERSCLTRQHWLHINNAVKHALTGVSLADLISPPRVVTATLHRVPPAAVLTD